MASKKPRKKQAPAQQRPRRSVSEVLSNAEETLEHARLCLEDSVSQDQQRRWAGLRNFITSARSVTFVLQTLRHSAPDFTDWYEGVRQRLAEDPIANAFIELRNEIEKEGSLGIVRRPDDFGVISFAGEVSRESFRAIAPDDAEVFLDGSGIYWVGSDGRRHYLRPDQIPGLNLDVTPGARFSGPLHETGRSVEELTHYYFDRLEELVIEAKLRFGHLP